MRKGSVRKPPSLTLPGGSQSRVCPGPVDENCVEATEVSTEPIEQARAVAIYSRYPSWAPVNALFREWAVREIKPPGPDHLGIESEAPSTIGQVDNETERTAGSDIESWKNMQQSKSQTVNLWFGKALMSCSLRNSYTIVFAKSSGLTPRAIQSGYKPKKMRARYLPADRTLTPVYR